VVVDVLIVLAGYAVGSIPFGVVLVRLLRGEDIRLQGSGNIGATNVWRTYGRRLGLPVALFDVAKGCGPALAGLLVAGPWVGVAAGIAAMLGHARPLYLRFARGGKMVATAGGVAFALAPLAALCCLVLWLAIFAVGRFSSVASMLSAASLPLLCWATGAPGPVIGFGGATFLGVIALHRANIRRLIEGTEPRFSRRARAA
jgi:acyl phosphate:glycerol-3-phosphate acyltransferase